MIKDKSISYFLYLHVFIRLHKGANLFRGWTVCENHQDVLGQMFDLLRRGELAQYRKQARAISEAAEQTLRGIVCGE